VHPRQFLAALDDCRLRRRKLVEARHDDDFRREIFCQTRVRRVMTRL
jgi:hypothetical protein